MNGYHSWLHSVTRPDQNQNEWMNLISWSHRPNEMIIGEKYSKVDQVKFVENSL